MDAVMVNNLKHRMWKTCKLKKIKKNKSKGSPHPNGYHEVVIP